MAASVKSGFSTNSSAYTSTCGPKPKDALVKVSFFNNSRLCCNFRNFRSGNSAAVCFMCAKWTLNMPYGKYSA